MNRGGRGPRQPGGGRQQAGPRQGARGKPAGKPNRPQRSSHGAKPGRARTEDRDTRHAAGRQDRHFDPRADRRDRPERAPHAERGQRLERAQRPARVKQAEHRTERPHRDPPAIVESKPAHQPAPVPTTVQTTVVGRDEDGMRLDRFFEARFPGLSFSHIQRIIRKGEVRVNGKRAEPKDRLSAGQTLRIPPLRIDAPKPRDDAPRDQKDRAFIKSLLLHEDDDVMVLNKPMGLSVQGGSGTTRHVDGMLGAFTGRDGQRPRLVHRLDKDTAGCLLIAKTRFAASALAQTFRSRSARKFYWALVAGVPRPHQGRISTFLAKEEREEDSFMRVARHGEDGASHAVTYYAVVETSGQKLAWMSLKPVTGRTHQLRAHMAHIGHPIVGDPKYFNIENWEMPGGLQNRLHLLARRIAVPHPRGGTIDVTAPLPAHMQQSWNLLGLDAKRYDPIEDAPEE
jgi:23S rRNA pseudouridine955/2504/2580 synthase